MLHVSCVPCAAARGRWRWCHLHGGIREVNCFSSNAFCFQAIWILKKENPEINVITSLSIDVSCELLALLRIYWLELKCFLYKHALNFTFDTKKNMHKPIGCRSSLTVEPMWGNLLFSKTGKLTNIPHIDMVIINVIIFSGQRFIFLEHILQIWFNRREFACVLVNKNKTNFPKRFISLNNVTLNSKM